MRRLTELVARSSGPEPRRHAGPPVAFRRRARLAIRGRADAPKLGIFEAGTHKVVHIPRCLVHHPVINRVAANVRDVLARHKASTYSDAAHAGVLRYLQVAVERASNLAQVVLVTNGSSPAGLEALFAELEQSLLPDLHSLWWNGNPEHANTILGPHWQKLAGADCIRDLSADAAIFYPPSAFGQSNLELAMQLAAQARALALPGDRVLELYAGVGAIGLGLAASAASLQLNELGEGSLEGLRLGIAALPAEAAAKVTVHAGAAAQSATLVADADFVIADPPRKGLDPLLVEQLLRTPPARFAYVSCDIDSFERDATRLLGAGSSLRLSSLDVYDLFPHTEHLEILACFQRA